MDHHSQRGFSGQAVLTISMHCSKCGAILQAKDGCQVSNEVKDQADNTGDSRAFFIQPCRACINRITAPAKALAEAVKNLTSEATK